MNWLIFGLMFPHLRPKCLKFLAPQIYRGLDVLRIASLLTIVALYIKRKKMPSPIIWVLGVLEGWICANTFLKGGDYVAMCSLAVSVMGVSMLADLYADRMKELLTSLMLNFEWLVYANLASVLIRPDKGLVIDSEFQVYIYFYSEANGFMYLCIPAVCVALLYLRLSLSQKHKVLRVIRAVALILASYSTVILTFPVTALLALTVIAIVSCLALIPGVRYLVNYPVACLFGLLANVFVAVFRIVETVPWLATFVKERLGKKPTLSNRTPIWADFTVYIREHLLTGVGYPKEGYRFGKGTFDHLHNQYFDMLALGGIIALLLYLTVLVLVGWKLTIHHKTWSARLMTAVMAGLFIMCIAEVCRQSSIFLLFPLAWHVDKIEEACLPEEVES